MGLPRRFNSRVVGVTFAPGYPMSVARLEARMLRPWLHDEPATPIPVTLVRDPGNPYDSNAVRVDVDGEHLGHIDRRTAERLAPSLDAGDEWVAEIVDVVVSEADPAHPGITVRLTQP